MMKPKKYRVNIIDDRTGRLVYVNGKPMGFETDHLALFADVQPLEARGDEDGIILQPLDLVPDWEDPRKVRLLLRGMFRLVRGLMPRDDAGQCEVMAAVTTEMALLLKDMVGARKAAEMVLHVAALIAADAREEDDE